MTTTSSESLWFDDLPDGAYPSLSGAGARYDVAVVGGGIAGLTTALELAEGGARVAVVEADRIGRGVTGCSTAKVTALQGSVLSTIESRHGAEKARAYAEASAFAVDRLAALVDRHGIECEMVRRPAFSYAFDDSELETVEAEHAAAARAGLPVELVDHTDLPFEVAGAVRLDEQVQVDPARYLLGLAAAVEEAGGTVFEDSRVGSVEEGSPCVLRTGEGSLTADKVVVATHYPILDRGFYFARLKPSRSYCVAMEIEGPPPEGMSISVGSNPRSIRSAGERLIVAGEPHETGSREASEERFGRLEEFARRHWEVRALTHRWSAQDPSAYDHLPLIGSYVPRSSRLFLATAFMKWGLGTGTFASDVLAGLILRGEHRWAAAFSPHRVSLRSLGTLAKINLKATHLLTDRLEPAEAGSVDEVPAGEARVVRTGLGKTGYFRDEEGELHGVSLRCTHMGCLVKFNEAERSWDCPCHGSRFDLDGSVLEGPATSPLRAAPPPAEDPSRAGVET
jgi:glycine/D-amino acid oxidase-like deaminating enzyme/nitrite reductase/ring-hydroxylating ferredoxin subunit